MNNKYWIVILMVTSFLWFASPVSVLAQNSNENNPDSKSSDLSKIHSGSRYAPGEIIIRFKSTVGPYVIKAMGDGGQGFLSVTGKADTDSLDRLNNRYKAKNPDLIFKILSEKERLKQFREKASAKVQKRIDAMEKGNFGLENIYLIKIEDPNADLEQVAAEYSQDPNVEYAEPNWAVELALEPTDAYYTNGTYWQYKNDGQGGGIPDADIDAPEAWDITTGSASVIVAVIDAPAWVGSGSDYSGNLWTNTAEANGQAGIDDDGNGYVDDIHGYSWAFGEPLEQVTCMQWGCSHGTFVNSVIGSTANDGGLVGVAWTTRLMLVNTHTEGGETFLNNYLMGIEYAYVMGADIANCSWDLLLGTPFPQSLYDSMATKPDLLFVVAAHNDGINIDLNPRYPASFDLPNIISVANTDRSDNLVPSSNYGSVSVDLGAPGGVVGDVVKTILVGSYYVSYITQEVAPGGGGTSFSAPHVSGVAALLKSYKPSVTVSEMKQAILQGADRIPSMQGKTVTGGRLNANKALLYLKNRPDILSIINSLLLE